MVTRSAVAGAPGATVSVVVRLMPVQSAVMVTLAVVVTGDVVTANAADVAPPLTMVCAGTWPIAGLLVDSCTMAPSVTPLNVTVPVAGLPPVTRLGVTETADSDGPGGVASLTDKFAVRGTLPMAAVSCTMVAGAAAFVATGKLAAVEPAGMTTVDGTVATVESLLNNKAVVGAGSGKIGRASCRERG